MENAKPTIENNGNRKYFAMIPYYIVNHSTAYEQSLYLVIKRIASEQGTCWASPATLAKIMGVSPNTVRKYREKLAQRGWIKKIGKRGKTKPTNEYEIVDLWELNAKFYSKKESSAGEQLKRKFNECVKKMQFVSLESSASGNKEETDKKNYYKERSNFKIIDNRFGLMNFSPKSYEEERCWEIARYLGEKDMRFILSALKKHGFHAIERAYNDIKERRPGSIENKGAYFNELLKRSA